MSKKMLARRHRLLQWHIASNVADARKLNCTGSLASRSAMRYHAVTATVCRARFMGHSHQQILIQSEDETSLLTEHYHVRSQFYIG